MTVSPALLQVESDTRSASTTPRLRTAAHKVTSCGEFTRRSEALVGAGAGRLEVQALGAWLQLWVGHARVDGTVWLTSSEAAEVLGVTVPTWRRWARLLVDAGLLAPHGRAYLVPAPAAMEGCLPGHRAPGGWRSLHRPTFGTLTDRLTSQGISGAQRAGALGLFAIVLLRHTYGRAGVDVVQAAALPALQQLLDRKTVTTYLRLLEGVLERPARGRLVYVGRPLLEHPWEAVVSPLDDVAAPAAGGSIPPSHARSLGQEPPLGQDPTPGEAGGTFVELLTSLDRRAPGAAESIRGHRLAKALLRSALLEVGRDVEGLAHELTRSSLDGARCVAGVLAHRVPDAVDALALREKLSDSRFRAERQAYAIQERREHLRIVTEREQQAAAAQRAQLHDDRDVDLAAIAAAAGDDYPSRLEAAGQLLFRAEGRGSRAELALLAVVRRRATAEFTRLTGDGSSAGQGRELTGRLREVPAPLLRAVVHQVLDDPQEALAAAVG